MDYEWVYKVDEFGFLNGQISTRAIAEGLVVDLAVIGEPPPADALLGPRQKWWWNPATLTWQAKLDNRGYTYYDPNDTTQVWYARRPDEQPPAGWVFAADGIVPLGSPAQLLREAKTRAKAAVNAARDLLLVQPVSYDGATYDAAQRDRDNIAGVLEKLRALEMLGQTPAPETLFWIDHDNVVHTFVDAVAYKAWLAGLVVAIADRGSAAYYQAIVKKNAIDAATSAEQVAAIAGS